MTSNDELEKQYTEPPLTVRDILQLFHSETDNERYWDIAYRDAETAISNLITQSRIELLDSLPNHPCACDCLVHADIDAALTIERGKLGGENA